MPVIPADICSKASPCTGGRRNRKRGGRETFFPLVLLLTVADFGSVSLWGAIGFNIWFSGEQSVVQG